MKRIFNLTLVFALLFALAGITTTVLANSDTHIFPRHTYTVIVGAEDPAQGYEANMFFPSALTVHVGDTVTWKANSIELHTVTFLAGQPMPALEQVDPKANPSPVLLNPQVANPAVPDQGQYDGKSFVNSGLMGNAPGLATTFSLTFTTPGTYEYVCVVHGTMMSGAITVVSRSKRIATPEQVSAQAGHQIREAMEQFPALVKQANAAVPAPVNNSDGSTSYTVLMGYMKDSLELMRFFPNRLDVHPGDHITWTMSDSNMAPHTVTFLNGGQAPDMLAVVPQQSAPPLLYFAPQVLFPANFTTLTNQGYINSGLLVPGQNPSATITVGDVSAALPYICVLHDESGMTGVINVTMK